MTREPAPLEQLTARLSERLDELRRLLLEDPGRAVDLVPEALESLSVSLEELAVTSEELEHQADELEATAMAANVERRRYEELFDLAPDGYLVTDPLGRILEANQAAADLLGRPASGLLGRRMTGFLATSRDLGRAFRLVQRLVRHGGEADLEILLKRAGRDDLPAWLRLSVSAEEAPRPAAQAVEPPKVRWALRDMSELASARTRLEEANRFKEAVLLALSHDLRSPLATIDAHVEALTSAERSEDQVEHRATEMRRAVRQMQVLMSNLFDVDRLGLGKVDLFRMPTDVVALVRRCADEVRTQVEVKTGFDPGGAVFDVDAGLVERIVRNLLANAEQYGRTDISVTVGAGADGEVVIAVEDRGPGIPDAAKEQVFELFESLNLTGPGTGVGLYVVHQFAELHGGSAWVEDVPGGGTSVRVRLPGSSAEHP
ncbi:MAG TPA: PAS domain-containing sensor histidine kinase [Acidimicrobiales bacterium]|nr:PAS domain-containing sensor histidine kinase [Acidimicrobiales bacterium]